MKLPGLPIDVISKVKGVSRGHLELSHSNLNQWLNPPLSKKGIDLAMGGIGKLLDRMEHEVSAKAGPLEADPSLTTGPLHKTYQVSPW